MQPRRERGIPLAWLVVVLVAIGAGLLYWARPTAPPAAPRLAPASRPAALTPPATVTPPIPDAARSSVPPGYTRVTRCVDGGRTSFTDGDCPPGATASQLLVQRDLNLADGTRLPPARPARTAPLAAESQVAAPAADTRRAECAGLAQAVERWDALARQPQSPQTQDWIAGQRRAARAQQFALRC